ncbi:exopolyphosphatase [Aspergillus bombycis]|uniref:Exopolyphosphatase n=1 Tax=Aspergillus bombycis TaxID=109264 RepID=A0A1F7ZMA3_9EURO|nr:exopolyphosphatase [Aspergillus bombycis]OGM40551.1 exopolyphosphatase [Aspergillus bombycis]
MANNSEHTLFRFLKTALQTHRRFLSGALTRAEAPVYVIGNPAADLDSIISAITYSYFANNTDRHHVPLINLPNVPSGSELRRLRPEFVKALWLSTHPPAQGEQAWEETPESAGVILHDHILTVADFNAHMKENGKDNEEYRISADAVLVDWNALPMGTPDGQKGKGSLNGLPTVEFNVIGCIDHHQDDGFLCPGIEPKVIEKSGSCASLVIHTLNKGGIWPEGRAEEAQTPRMTAEEQVASLAVTPVLIDTTNLTAKDKVTQFDVQAVDFLTPKFNKDTTDKDTLYAQVFEAKQNSLDLLTVDEILDRDYKQWTETPPREPGTPLNIGFCSMVRPIPWVVRKAGSPQEFLDAVYGFATKRELSIVVVMAAFSSSDDKFHRELFVCALDEGLAVDAVKNFVKQSSSQLGLEEWSSLDGDSGLSNAMKDTLNSDNTHKWRHIWTATDTTKSRKQVAPMMREAVTSLR